MRVLVLNCGSSSVKFQLFDTEAGQSLARGLVEKVGSSMAGLRYRPETGNDITEVLEVLDHGAAIRLALSTLCNPSYGVIEEPSEVDAVGHRVVHGGERFSDAVLITDDVVAETKACSRFAPLHNPHNLKGILACRELLPGVPQVAVYDTAFHQTMPEEAYLYALPLGLYRKLGIRRYGFHGTSHRYVAGVAAQELDRPLAELKLITCHLGNGASIAAVREGKSVDTSMGFTPLEGLVMGTRCGDIDPAIVPYVIQRERLSAAEADALMNKSSGLLGLTESTNDMREIEEEALGGSDKCRLALEIFCRRVKKYVGAYAALLGGVDAVVFTGGIGENSWLVRQKSVEGLEFMGIVLHHDKNRAHETVVSSGDVAVMVIRTNEELAIAKDTVSVLSQARKAEEAVSAAEELKALSDSLKAEIVLEWAKGKRRSAEELRQWLKDSEGLELSREAMELQIDLLGLPNSDSGGEEGDDG
jgi:acetate kinase